MVFRHGALSRRDAFLLLLGASLMHIWSMLFNQNFGPSDQSIVINTHLSPEHNPIEKLTTVTTTALVTKISQVHSVETQTVTSVAVSTPTPKVQSISPRGELPPTSMLAHAPGWTLFRDLYMSNGTLFVVVDEKERLKLPETRLMISTPLAAYNTPENIAAREPLSQQMSIITPEEAQARWGVSETQQTNRIWTVEGNTLLSNDPNQFLRHYYHFVAELFFGVQAFWHGAFSQPVPLEDTTPSSPHYSLHHPAAPPFHRAIFAYSNADGWRDNPGFNSYFLRAAFPSLTVEHEEDWNDRILATRSGDKAWHFPFVLLTDRSSAHRGPVCGSQTQRTAAEAWEFMRLKGKLRGLHVGGWWAPLRDAVWRFAGAEEGLKSTSLTFANASDPNADFEVVGADAKLEARDIVNVGSEHQTHLPMPEKIVINYISRQSTHHRKLIQEDHEGLVAALNELVERKNKERMEALSMLEVQHDVQRQQGVGTETTPASVPLEWEFNELIAEHMSKDEQIRAAARTTIMIGVHGNGLSHLVFMPPKKVSTVLEIFFPGGFAHDYQWTTRALGMTHYAVWNDTHHTFPNEPRVDYPEGFQGNEIPVHGPSLAQLIEDRVAGVV